MKPFFCAAIALLLFTCAGNAQTVLQPMVFKADDGSLRVEAHSFTLAPGHDHLRGSDPVSLTYITDIQQELQLVPEQMARLEEAQREIQTDMMKGLQGLSTDVGSNEEIQARYAETMTELRESAFNKLESVLLPHQVKILREIQLHKQLKKDGSKGLLLNDYVIKELALDDRQKQEIEDRINTAERELQEKIEKLKEEALENVLAVLTSKQRSQLDELRGKVIEH